MPLWLAGLVTLRAKVSTLMAYRYKTTKWNPPVPSTPEELEKFMESRTEWKSDPLWGLLDHIQPVEHMNYQLLMGNSDVVGIGIIHGDCDDLATYAGYMLDRMGATSYRVNMPKYQHVICVFKYITLHGEYKYSWFSNQTFAHEWYKDLRSAVNGWCKSKDDGKSGPIEVEIL